ncbi:MAG: beta-galactosidase, partial [Spirochaetota bacterium]
SDSFIRDGDPFRIISGSIHYFRSHPDRWHSNLKKLADFGCNTVCTFVPWNLHMPERNRFIFDGMLDLARYISTAEKLGLLVILRPGPYICADIDGGGIPVWVLEECGYNIRCSNQHFMEGAKAYIEKFCETVAPYTYGNGGPVIMVQIENEYGSYGNDRSYMESLKNIFQQNLPPVVLFTADQPREENLKAGSIPGTLAATFFGSHPEDCLSVLDTVPNGSPHFCLEFWSGGHDYWGSSHHIRTPESTAETFDKILSSGASVNIYMFHGGTNYGFTAGACSSGGTEYKPIITSYDYDALLSESGDITPKYLECRKALEKHITLPPLEKQTNDELLEKSNIIFPQHATLFQSLQYLSTPVFSVTPMTMEELGEPFGLVLYRTRVEGPLTDALLLINGLCDWAQVFVNGVYHSTLYRAEETTDAAIDIPASGATIDILVENLGRISAGPGMAQPKGITGGVLLNGRYLFNWEIYPVSMAHTENIPFKLDSSYRPEKVPSFYLASFSIERPRDTYIDLSRWHKGVCYVNNFNLGRYWDIGPQQALYVPAPLLRKGKNTLIVFEHYEVEELSIEFRKSPLYGRRSHKKKSLLSRFFSHS